MPRSGELVQWNNKGGFGFVRDAAGNDFYVHISKLAEGQTRPRIGDRLSYDVASGRNGRPAAINVAVAVAAPLPERSMADIKRPSGAVSRYKVGLRTAAATMMTLLILLAIGTDRAPVWLGGTYALMGAASALLYRFDKLYALSGRWRVSELNLHVVDFCFGIIGGLAAQEVYRHKTVKPRFVATTWAIALLHVIGLAALAMGWVSVALP
ncbi:DUF1294 domain-containing protein [Devosia beringensis]|uniref:DUF1294 domain-containing protein n=1 Tax=Devosia beringensis TaxID=2657486 RepID=UPI00186B6AAC|nr:DUF1294 domain-containing protein [Devosia beringensis]